MEQQRVAMACLKEASRKTFLASGSMFHESCVVFDLCVLEETVGMGSRRTDIQDRTGHPRPRSLHSTYTHTYPLAYTPPPTYISTYTHTYTTPKYIHTHTIHTSRAPFMVEALSGMSSLM